MNEEARVASIAATVEEVMRAVRENFPRRLHAPGSEDEVRGNLICDDGGVGWCNGEVLPLWEALVLFLSISKRVVGLIDVDLEFRSGVLGSGVDELAPRAPVDSCVGTVIGVGRALLLLLEVLLQVLLNLLDCRFSSAHRRSSSSGGRRFVVFNHLIDNVFTVLFIVVVVCR